MSHCTISLQVTIRVPVVQSAASTKPSTASGAPRAWHMTLRKKLLERGFVVCEADPSLFILWDKVVGVWLRSMLTT
jgi:hypothetical protein